MVEEAGYLSICDFAFNTVFMVVSGGRVVNGSHADGDGRWWTSVLQRASTAGDETSARHASAETEEHTSC